MTKNQIDTMFEVHFVEDKEVKQHKDKICSFIKMMVDLDKKLTSEKQMYIEGYESGYRNGVDKCLSDLEEEHLN